MRKAIYALAILFTLFGLAKAQEKGPDTTKIYIGVTNVSVPFDNYQGVNAQGQIKIYRFGDVTLQAAGDFAAFFPGYNSVELYTFQAGPKVGVDLADRKVTLSGMILFGTFTTFNSDSTYAYLAGGDVDVNVTKRLFVRAGYGRQFVRDAGISFNRLTFGGGFRF